MHDQPDTLANYIPAIHRILILLVHNVDREESDIQARINTYLFSRSSPDYDSSEGHQRAIIHLFEIFRYIWSRTWTPTDEQLFPDPTLRALAYGKLTSSGAFAEPKHTTGELAKITYGMRLIFLFAMHHDTSKKLYSSVEEACTAMEPYFREKHYTTFNSIRSLQHYASSRAKDAPQIPTVIHPDRNDPGRILYLGDPISWNGVTAMFAALEDDLINVFEEKVGLGLAEHLQLPKLTSVADDLSNKAVGYSFLTDPRNSYGDASKLVLRAVLNTPTLADKFLGPVHPVTGERAWNQHAMRLYILNVVEWLSLLAGRCETGSGAPIRGTELASMAINNSATRSRNLFFIGQHLCLIGQYSKTTALTRKDKLILHALDAVTSDLLMRYLVFYLPWIHVCISAMFPREKDSHIIQLWQTHLFVNVNTLWTTDKLTEIMKRYTKQHLGVALGISDWRHVQIAFHKVMCRDSLRRIFETDWVETMAAEQAGHSAEVENHHYAQSADGLNGNSERTLDAHIQICIQYQTMAGVVPSGISKAYYDCTHDRLPALIASGQILSVAPAAGVFNTRVADDPDAIAKKVVELIWPKLVDHLDGWLGNSKEMPISEQFSSMWNRMTD